MKVLITDRVNEKLIDRLLKIGLTVNYKPGITINELLKIIINFDILIVRGRLSFTDKVLSKANNLKLIIRYGVGLDNIDVKYCEKRGIKVYNIPEAFTEAVAEHTLALILGILRNIGNAHLSLKEGKWIKEKFIGRELFGKVVGIIGFGRIGKRVAELLKPFRVKILAYDIIPIPKRYIRLGVRQVSDIMDIAKQADIITIHVPLTEKTRNLINDKFLSACKKGIYIINTSRGEVIDETALKKYIRLGKIAGIALDVFKNEPNIDKEIIAIGDGLFTPHIGGQTLEANHRAVDKVIEIIEREIKRRKES